MTDTRLPKARPRTEVGALPARSKHARMVQVWSAQLVGARSFSGFVGAGFDGAATRAVPGRLGAEAVVIELPRGAVDG